MQAIRIIKIPNCKMVSSGIGMFGEENFTAFEDWFSSLPATKDARNFLAEAEGGLEWLFLYEEGMAVPEQFPIIDFKGGLYAVSTDIDGQTDTAAMDKELLAFLQKTALRRISVAADWAISSRRRRPNRSWGISRWTTICRLRLAQRKNKTPARKRKGDKIMSEKSILTFQIHQKAFSFLGSETILTDSTVPSDCEQIWERFFAKGGYAPILPYAIDPKPVNVWYTNERGEFIYSQGLFVEHVAKAPEGYTLSHFDGGDYLVVTTEWMETNEEAVGDNGNGRVNRYAETVAMPEGYVRSKGPIAEIEKENADTPQGSRYEVWVPMENSC